MKATKEQVMNLVNLGKKDMAISKLLGVSRQRIHQLRTGYLSPSNRVGEPIDHKILTKKKRIAIGIGDFKVDSSRGGREFINEIVRTRDNHSCQICGKVWVKGQRRLDVHHMDEHMDGKSRIPGILKYNRENLDKLVTLCHRCHFNLDRTRFRISNRLSPLRKK